MKQLLNRVGAKFRRKTAQVTPSAIILMYHRISDTYNEPNWLAVSPNNFARQLAYIKREYHPISLTELVTAVRSGSIPNKAVVITFDDGYKDNFTNAFPLLESMQIPATIFVVTGYIDNQREFWWDELSNIIMADTVIPAELSITVQGRLHSWQTETVEQRLAAHIALQEIIKYQSPVEKDRILAELSQWSGIKPTVRDEYRTMNHNELQEIASSKYVELGAHTQNHPILSTLTVNEQHREIVNSRLELEEIIGQTVRTFAYPNGDFTAETVGILRDAGFESAVTTKDGCLHGGEDLLQLNRCAVNNWRIEEFEQKLTYYFSIGVNE